MIKKHLLVGIACCLWGMNVAGQSTRWDTKAWEARIAPDGCLERLVFKGKTGNDTVPFFRSDGHAGPSFYAVTEGKTRIAEWVPDGRRSYRAVIDDVECRLTYKSWQGQPALEVTLVNQGHVPFQPQMAGLRLGIDTYMEKYPDWFGKYFPTGYCC